MSIQSIYYDEFNEIEDILSENLCNRGLGKVKLEGQLYSCLHSLDLSKTVVIVTGFAIMEAKIGETDGPPGALALGYALEKLNKKVIFVTDKYSEEFMRVGVKLLNLNSTVIIFEQNKENFQSEELLSKFKPDHIIGIERPGRNFQNKCYSMRGEDISELCPNTDLLFIKAKEKNIVTSAIGDGGNEIGMGKVKHLIQKYVNKGNIICAQFETDNLILAGVSNWGAYGLCAGLSILNNKMLMIEEYLYQQILFEIVKAGAVDGCSKKNEATVDGLTYEENLNVFLNIRKISSNYIKNIYQ